MGETSAPQPGQRPKASAVDAEQTDHPGGRNPAAYHDRRPHEDRAQREVRLAKEALERDDIEALSRAESEGLHPPWGERPGKKNGPGQ